MWHMTTAILELTINTHTPTDLRIIWSRKLRRNEGIYFDSSRGIAAVAYCNNTLQHTATYCNTPLWNEIAYCLEGCQLPSFATPSLSPSLSLSSSPFSSPRHFSPAPRVVAQTLGSSTYRPMWPALQLNATLQRLHSPFLLFLGLLVRNGVLVRVRQMQERR